jgi:hypothetical protein
MQRLRHGGLPNPVVSHYEVAYSAY